ncbi:hypothetical protein ANN_26812 [Periplaneta americana]|uniref:Reverse transcriptase domain-containing protein n=1 Tax=Periplaneta americana TaxID=6978 RepID=A0ABQ8RZ80_PERAM|nr:hypothetical protein ANN_26812 [Periplaneta americana]
MAKVLVSRLHVYMRNRNLIPTTQAGFRPGAQLHDQLIRVLTPIEKAYTRRHYSILIALDAKKAFDTVWIDALKYKLTSLNLPHEITHWLSSFISNRTGQVEIYYWFVINLDDTDTDELSGGVESEFEEEENAATGNSWSFEGNELEREDYRVAMLSCTALFAVPPRNTADLS